MASRWQHFPRSLEFGSHFVYPRPARSDAEQNAKAFLLRVKQDFISPVPPHEHLLDRAVERIHGAWLGGAHQALFGPDVTLIPMPGAGRQKPHTISSPRTICDRLVSLGMAARVFSCIERLTAVQKSAFAGPGERPGPQDHYDSMRVVRGVEDFTEIVIVDDIVTRGSTFLGAAARLLEVFPNARIRAFAVARTARMTGGIEAPCAGTITINGGQPRRDP